MRLLVVAVCLLAGCDQVFGILPVPARDGNGCIGAGDGMLAGLCPPDEIQSRIIAGSFDTDVCTMGEVRDSQHLCILWGTDITVNDTQVFGGRVLVIAAVSSLGIDGVLDASGHGQTAGPNGRLECPSPAGGGAAGISGVAFGGGGAGGCGSGVGGTGGPSNTVAGGIACASVLELDLAGGCSGADGGSSFGGPVDNGAGGGGGGAVYLIAGNMIVLRGDVLAGGGAGAPGRVPGGGAGGGGAGGLIAFDTPNLMVIHAGATPRVCAAGGAGGGGASTTGAGMPGQNGCMAGAAAIGGAGGGIGGNGGQGGASSRAGGNAPAASGGGGGGGGAAGFIGVYGDSSDKLADAMTIPPGSF